MANIFLRDERRPAAGLRRQPRSSRTIRTGAICLLFYEYFHGDNGAGLGASHQTGWTGVVARIMHLFATTTAEQVLELGKIAGVVEVAPARDWPPGARRPAEKA